MSMRQTLSHLVELFLSLVSLHILTQSQSPFASCCHKTTRNTLQLIPWLMTKLVSVSPIADTSTQVKVAITHPLSACLDLPKLSLSDSESSAKLTNSLVFVVHKSTAQKWAVFFYLTKSVRITNSNSEI
jgi:hypothetical protein